MIATGYTNLSAAQCSRARGGGRAVGWVYWVAITSEVAPPMVES
jgi:hypothetical protein